MSNDLVDIVKSTQDWMTWESELQYIHKGEHSFAERAAATGDWLKNPSKAMKVGAGGAAGVAGLAGAGLLARGLVKRQGGKAAAVEAAKRRKLLVGAGAGAAGLGVLSAASRRD